MEIQIGVAKVNKYASSESGDTLEVIERPNGGLSVVLADGQRSGRSAKRISNMVVRKVISLLAEGVRDGAAARAASDYLLAQRGGKVMATLNIMSIDLVTNTIVITRNNPAPILIGRGKVIELLDQESTSVGIYRGTRPCINEIELSRGLTIVAFSDGLVHAGSRNSKKLDLIASLQSMLNDDLYPQQIADALMSQAMELDQGRPVDDISVVAISVLAKQEDNIRRMSVRLPIR
ncbi:SpoIIE family protein phosphatase [Chloroflexota bacterium]